MLAPPTDDFPGTPGYTAGYGAQPMFSNTCLVTALVAPSVRPAAYT